MDFKSKQSISNTINSRNVLKNTLIPISVTFIGYGQAQKYEGSPCTLYDGSSGICKNALHCVSIKEGLRSGKLRYQNIVTCSFMGSDQIACCGDERPLPGRNQPTPHTSPSTDFVFVSARRSTTEVPTTKRVVNEYLTTTKRSNIVQWLQDILFEYSTTPKTNTNTIDRLTRSTTPKPNKATTTNSFWDEWSAMKPTNLHDKPDEKHSWDGFDLNKENNRHEPQRQNIPVIFEPSTTKKTVLAPWMEEVLNEYTTTPRSNTRNNMQNYYTIRTTTPVSHNANEMPSWMQEVLSEYSTTTTAIGMISMPVHFETDHTKMSFLSGVHSFGGGSNGDLHQPYQNSNDNDSSTFNRHRPGHVTPKPFPTDSQTNSRYSSCKAEAACEFYSTLAPDTGIAWKILGGTEAGLGEFPWMAALGYDTDDRSFDCGGSIISNYFILTAAHCIPSRRRPIKVRLGKVTLLTNDDDAIPVDLNIQQIILHPEYKSSTKKNDIALIRVAERIKFTEDIRPACLQTDINDVLPDVGLYVTGWGSISAERTIRPAVLLKTNVTSMPLSICNSTLLDYNRQIDQPSLRDGISQSQCCAFDPQARNDACQGDSGGPLTVFSSPAIGTIVGIVSFGIGCGSSLPGVTCLAWSCPRILNK